MYPYFLFVLTAYIDNNENIGLLLLCYEPFCYVNYVQLYRMWQKRNLSQKVEFDFVLQYIVMMQFKSCAWITKTAAKIHYKYGPRFYCNCYNFPGMAV